MNKLAQLGIDICQNRLGNFTKEDATQALRSEFVKICGTDKIDRKIFRRHKVALFEIIEESLDVLVGNMIQDAFQDNAEYKNVGLGDNPLFILKNPNLYKVAIVSDGNKSLRRQRLDNGTMSITPSTRGVKIYEEFNRFVSGRIDWAEMVDKVSKSYVNQIYTEVYEALYDSYSDLTATYAKNGVFNDATMRTLIEHIESANGVTAAIYGTKTALSNVTTAQVSEAMKDVYGSQGYYGSFYGTPMRKIQQSHTNGTQTFAVNESFLMVLPEGDERIVKILDEGDSYIEETAEGVNEDMSKEYLFLRKTGVGIVTSSKFGIYRLL